MTWSVNGVILTRGPFTLEAHRWPFCGNGVGHEITPFTPEPPGRQVLVTDGVRRRVVAGDSASAQDGKGSDGEDAQSGRA